VIEHGDGKDSVWSGPGQDALRIYTTRNLWLNDVSRKRGTPFGLGLRFTHFVSGSIASINLVPAFFFLFARTGLQC
jgi:hypothetical protein